MRGLPDGAWDKKKNIKSPYVTQEEEKDEGWPHACGKTETVLFLFISHVTAEMK